MQFMKNRTILIASGLAAACILILMYHRDAIFHYRYNSPHSKVSETKSFRTNNVPKLSQPWIHELQSSRPIGSEPNGRVNTSLNIRPVSFANVSKLYLKLTQSSDIEASKLFRDCLWLMDHGDYREAQLKLETFVNGKSLKNNQFMAPAYWMLAWCILNEGGNANLSDAANRFFNFTWWERDLIAEDYDVLTNAASFNCAVIYTHLLSQENQDYELLTRNTKWVLNSFLEKWPNDPREAEVRNLLDSLNGAHR
jgi:hypothetical protein